MHLAINHLVSSKCEWNNCFIKNNQKRSITSMDNVKNAQSSQIPSR